jgi:hypothetical protein
MFFSPFPVLELPLSLAGHSIRPLCAYHPNMVAHYYANKGFCTKGSEVSDFAIAAAICLKASNIAPAVALCMPQ